MEFHKILLTGTGQEVVFCCNYFKILRGFCSPDNSGIFVDEHTNEDVEWPAKFSCFGQPVDAQGGDAFQIEIITGNPNNNGRLCNAHKTYAYKFICKSFI